jgi:hypothetical protein
VNAGLKTILAATARTSHTPAAAGPPPDRWVPLLVALAAVLASTFAAWHYARLDLTLAHYDARAHLVVARRILDSLTPGWQQIGAVWLPLPHVLNMLPVQVDSWYRSGASAVAISIGSMGLGCWALTRMIRATTGSTTAALAGVALMLGNPNLLYLQSTPMTEPLLVGTCLLAVACTVRWVDDGAPLPARAPGWAIAAACMTRYEAWPICAMLIGLAALALVRRGAAIEATVRACSRLASYPAIAILLFTLNSRWTTGSWFVPAGFFVAENEALGHAWLALQQVRESTYLLSGTAWVWPACAGAALLVAGAAVSARHTSLVLVIALAAAAALPWYAYYAGHPLRVRYGVPLVAACASLTAGGIALLWKPLRPLASAAVLLWAFSQSSPLDTRAPLVTESQRDAANSRGREAVTTYLRQHWDGSTIMMSMGSLAHYMHDLASHGFEIRDFLQEGNEQLWVHAATLGPRGYVQWVVIEEHAEGGDALHRAAQRDPEFLQGFTRVAEGGGVALYRFY